MCCLFRLAIGCCALRLLTLLFLFVLLGFLVVSIWFGRLILFILIFLLFFGVFVLADGVLPGIISNYFKPYVAAVLLLINIVLIFFVGQKIGAHVSLKTNKKTALTLVFLSALLLFLNFLGINILLNLFLV
jgi:hypothetical protein